MKVFLLISVIKLIRALHSYYQKSFASLILRLHFHSITEEINNTLVFWRNVFIVILRIQKNMLHAQL